MTLWEAAFLLLAHVTSASKTIHGPDKTACSPAFEQVPATGFFPFESIQLTDRVLSKLAHEKCPLVFSVRFNSSDLSPVSNEQQHSKPTKQCKTYPDDSTWPSNDDWGAFNETVGGALIKTTPEAAICYSNWGHYSASDCQSLTTSWNNSTLRIQDPTSIRSVLFEGMTCMPPEYTASFLGVKNTCTTGGYPEYTVNVTNVAQIQLAVNFARERNIRLVIKNTGHDFGAKSTGHGALSIWTHHLKDAQFYESFDTSQYSGPAFRFGAGIQVYDANGLAKQHGVTVVGGEGKTVGLVGGYIQGGGHSPLTSIWGMAADHVLSIQMVTADGRFITANATTNPDLFWAVRGGGGSTFGVVTSMTIKAFPKIKTTIMSYNLTTNAMFTHDQFWRAQRAYVDEFDRLASLGYYAYYRIRHVGDEITHDMTSMVAPNTSEQQFRASMAPLWSKWAAIGVPFAPAVREFDNYADAWAAGFPQEAWTWTMRQASRLVPRDVLTDEASRGAVFDAVRGVFDEGANLIMFNIRNPPGAAQAAGADNAVNPAWREALMFALMFVTWGVADPPGRVAELSRNLTYDWNPRWRALTPGSGTYMSESDYIEPDWQTSFHGANYKRLYEIKQRWDPEGVFYAQNAVGSEDWEMSGMILGHLPSQNSKLCRK